MSVVSGKKSVGGLQQKRVIARALGMVATGALLGWSLAGHARAQSASDPVYAWVSATTPPANVVKAADAPNRPVCRGTGEYNRPWTGFWNGTICIGSYGGNVMPAGANVQFLTFYEGTSAAKWVSGSGKQQPGNIGTVPANTINAGNTYTNLPQVLCSQAGYVGWVYSNTCAIGASGLSMQQTATVLIGSMPPVYTWVAATTPPANVVKSADGSRAVCRGTGAYNRPWAGYWNGSTCLGSYGGNTMPAGGGLQFLTLVAGTPAPVWFSGTNKQQPGNIGTVPADTINAGKTYSGYDQVLCSFGGYVGWVYSNTCAVGAGGLSMQQTATVLVGAVK